MSLGIAATSTDMCTWSGECASLVPGVVFLLITVGWVASSVHVVDRLVLGCQEFSTARWIHVAMWVSVPLYCHGGMGSPFGVHCRHETPVMADSPFERQPICLCSVLSLCYSIVGVCSCPL